MNGEASGYLQKRSPRLAPSANNSMLLAFLIRLLQRSKLTSTESYRCASSCFPRGNGGSRTHILRRPGALDQLSYVTNCRLQRASGVTVPREDIYNLRGCC